LVLLVLVWQVNAAKNDKSIKRKRSSQQKTDENVASIANIDPNILIMVCDYLHIGDMNAFQRTNRSIYTKLNYNGTSVPEMVLRQFMRLVRTPNVHCPLYDTTKRVLAHRFQFIDASRYELMKKYQKFTDQRWSLKMKEDLVKSLSRNNPTASSDMSTNQYMYLERIADMSKFEFDVDNTEPFVEITSLNNVPFNVFIVYDVSTSTAYFRLLDKTKFYKLQMKLPAFIVTEKKRRQMEHYNNIWNYKIDSLSFDFQNRIIDFRLVKDMTSEILFGVEIDDEINFEHYYVGSDISFVEKVGDTIYFPNLENQ